MASCTPARLSGGSVANTLPPAPGSAGLLAIAAATATRSGSAMPGAVSASRSPSVAANTPDRIAVSTATPMAEPSCRAVLANPDACPIRRIGISSSVAPVSWLIANPTPVP